MNQTPKKFDWEIACGIDLVDVARLGAVIQRRGEKFLRRCFGEVELLQAGKRVESLAARFAAKEACLKALGTGLRGMRWRDIQTRLSDNGKPELLLSGEVLAAANRQGWANAAVSLSHASGMAIASVVVLKRPAGDGET